MAEGQKINISQYLTNRVASQTISTKISLVEKDYLMEIFSEDFYLSDRFPNIEEVSDSIKILDRNFFYDIYKFSYENLSYAIKVGERIDNFIFNKEKDALEAIKDLNLAPMYFHTDSSESYSYLLTSFENAQTTKEIGLSYTFDKIELLGSALAKIHNKTKQDNSERDYFLDSVFSLGDYEDTTSSEVFDGLKEIDIFNECQDLLDTIKKAVNLQNLPNGEEISCLCHTNINPGAILNRTGRLKICNFYQSFYIHPAWDLAFTSYKLGLNDHPTVEKRFLESYHLESFLKEDEYNYVFFKQLASKLMLYTLVASYFYTMTSPNQEMGNTLSLFRQYASIRDVIQDEFAEYMPILDQMFAPFINNI